TTINNVAFKADAKWRTSVRGNFTFYNDDKSSPNRAAGPTRALESAWDQSGPTRYYKGEGNFIPLKNLYVTARGAHISAGFDLLPLGGLTRDYFIDDAGTAHGSYYQYDTRRPQRYFGGDGSYFAGVHEVKFGGSLRHTSAD